MPICPVLVVVGVWNHRRLSRRLKPPSCRPPPISCCTSQNTFKRTRRSLPARAKVLGIPIVGHNQMQPCGCAFKATRRPRQRRCTVGHTGWSVSSVSRPLFGKCAHMYSRESVCLLKNVYINGLFYIYEYSQQQQNNKTTTTHPDIYDEVCHRSNFYCVPFKEPSCLQIIGIIIMANNKKI